MLVVTSNAAKVSLHKHCLQPHQPECLQISHICTTAVMRLCFWFCMKKSSVLWLVLFTQEHICALQLHSMALCEYVYCCSGQQLCSSGKRGQAHGQHLPAFAACAAESSSYATDAPGTVEDKPCSCHWASHLVCTKAMSASNFGSFEPLAKQINTRQQAILTKLPAIWLKRKHSHVCLSQLNNFQLAILAASSIPLTS